MADNEATTAQPSSGDLDFNSGDEIEEEVFDEEEYYEEEAVDDDDDEYEDEEIIEEYEEESEEENESPKEEPIESSHVMDDSTAPPPSLSDSTPSDNNSRPKIPDPEGITDFATFPAMSEEFADEASDALISGSTTSMSLNDANDSVASQQTSQMTSQPITQPMTTIDEKSSVFVADEENQANLQFVPPKREAPAGQSPVPVNVAPPQIEKETKTASPMWYWAVFALVCALLAGGAYVGWYLVNEDRKDAPNLNEDQTRAPTAAPTVGLTTAFDPIQGDCDFQDLRHPHVIDQCKCVGEIQIIPDDVRKRYKSRKANFIPTIYEEYNEDITDCSPRNQALVWISSGNDFEFTYQERVERFALATLFAGLDGTQWKRNDGWFSEDSVCTWEGVVCHDDGMVQTVDLSNYNLKGTVPPEVGLLEAMMQFFAGRNEIDGVIPEALFSLKILQAVDLSVNLITGPIPPAVGSSVELRELNLQENQLSGRISQLIGNAAALEVLSMGGNQIVGSIPTSFFKLGNLTFLDIGGNDLTGSIPTEIGNLQNLTSLTLGPNQFQGDIPSTIGALTKLEYLNVREIPELSGRLPAVYGRNLTELVDLIITQTKVSGNIETDFGALQKLVQMDLSNNQLRGTIPTQLGNLQSLVILNLGNNFLEGPIPTTLGTLGSIEQLNLNNNVLTGDVPIQIADLEGLQSLQLETNLLTGRVPEDICGLRNANLTTFIVDCSYAENGVQVGVMCEVPSCCTGCRTAFTN